MNKYTERQEAGFTKLKEILQKKESTETIQSCMERLEKLFRFYIVVELNWEDVLAKSQELNGHELETFLLQIVKFVNTYDE